MKNLILLAAAAFISGCATVNISRTTSSDSNFAPVVVPAVVQVDTKVNTQINTQLNTKSYSCTELIKVYKTKIKNTPEVNSSPIQLDFQLVSPSQIANFKVKISESGKLSEVFSSEDQVVKGIMSSELKKPLAGLMTFTVSEENGDRFELFVAPSVIAQDQFFAYGKISFDDDASKITRLTCAVSKGL